MILENKNAENKQLVVRVALNDLFVRKVKYTFKNRLPENSSNILSFKGKRLSILLGNLRVIIYFPSLCVHLLEWK